MRFIAALALLLTASRVSAAEFESVDRYIALQGPISLQGVLNNIGTSGSKSEGAYASVVIASPSTENPNYLFTWIRDSSLVMKVLIDRYVDGRDKTRLPLITQWVTSQSKLQGLDNLSGVANGTGLGEPKFNINETVFTGSWGRPQRDGPALRTSALITLANHLLDTHNTSYVESTLWPIITLDLNYVAQWWNQSTFDLWEEVQGSSFFTTAVQHRALREGVALASRIRTPTDSTNISIWKTQAQNLLCFLNTYWTGSFILANTKSDRSGIDVNTILASIHTYSSNAGCDAKTFQPCSDKALADHKVVVDSFRDIYEINNGTVSNAAVAIGRYQEDVYYTGNPWYLATFAAAEQLYLSLATWSSQQFITVTDISQPFFEQFVPDIKTGTYKRNSPTYSKISSSVRLYADGFIAMNQRYTPSNGGLSEQYSKDNGTTVSAADLTWSYASALTAFDRRAGILGTSWPATGLTVPTTCSPGPTPPMSTVEFIVNATTSEGERNYVTGSVDALAAWDPDNALPLDDANYPLWTTTVNVTADTYIEYKYIRKANGTVTWESDPNNNFTSAMAGGSITLNDVWR